MSTSNSKERIVFLFGSGISIGAGMPKFYEITERVLSGKGIYYDRSSEIFTSHKPHQNDLARTQEENARRVVEFIHRLKPEIEYYYKKHRFKLDTNYEDFYYMISQIHDSERGEYDNPAVQPLVDKILPDIKSLLEKTSTESKWTISKLAKVAMNYIEYVVFRELSREPKSLDYLSCIKEACEDTDLSKVDIFTLNYDTVLVL